MSSKNKLIINELNESARVLDAFLNDSNNIELIAQAAELMTETIRKGGKLISCGNGGSFCDAMHFAEELSGRFRENRKALPAVSISDASHLTCVGNDYGFDYIFSRYVEAIGNSNDLLLAISTSGNSKNIINASIAAKEKGMKVVALTGKNGGQLAQTADVNICVHHNGYADRIQEIHIKIIHCLILLIEKEF
jgi:D-sedoheptulose 7-phosphate isomerase